MDLIFGNKKRISLKYNEKLVLKAKSIPVSRIKKYNSKSFLTLCPQTNKIRSIESFI